MTNIKDLRAKIINKLWSYTTTDAKRSPDFHKWLEELILSDRKEFKSRYESAMESISNQIGGK